MDPNKYTLPHDASLLDVLKKISNLSSLQTVIIINDNNQVIGTITDGDVRRGLINGLTLDEPINSFMFKDFHYLEEDKNNFAKLKTFREKKLKAVPLLNGKKELLKLIDFTKTKSILPVDAVIMAGGLGTRLKPLTANTPKPLLKIGGKEIVSYNFDRLYQYGITNQSITVNYLGEQIEKFCSDYNNNINFKIVKETEFLGTAGSLSLIDSFKNDTVLLMNSDLLTNIDYEDFYKSFIDSDADIMVASIPYPVNLPYAIFDLEAEQIKSFKEKPSFTYYANAGIYLIKKDIISEIPKNRFFNATDLMDLIINSDRKLIHYPIFGYWLDIGKHQDFEKAQKDISNINWD